MEHLKWRNNQYINSEKNITLKIQKKIVLDYGCGPVIPINILILQQKKYML